jgi:hypothetical protein
MMLFSAGTASALAGIVCLYSSWRGDSPGRRWRVPAGWLLLILAMVPWILASGAEFGVAYGAMLTSVLAWLVVLFNAEFRQHSHREKAAGRIGIPAARTAGRHLLLFTAAVPLAGAAAIFTSVALTLVLPWKAVNGMVLAVYIMPLLWGLGSYWACADEKLLRPTLGLSACTLLSALPVYM